MARRPTTSELDRYITAARDAGCPPDQVRRFVDAAIVLQPRQLAASAAGRLCDQPDGPTQVAYGGARGGGKSHWALSQVVCDDCQRFSGLKALYLRKVGKAGKEAVQDLRREVLHTTPHQYKTQENVIVLPNGSKVVLGHFQNEKDIDSYLGLQYDLALIEEATQLSSRKVKDIATCVRTAKPGWRPRMYLTFNPGGVGHSWAKAAFIEPYRRGRETATRFVQATVRDNSFVNAEYRSTLEALTGWQRRAWLDGDWDIAAGQFFTTFRRDIHVVPPGAIPEHWRVWIGLDYGFVHYTVAHVLAEDGDGNIFVCGEHAAQRWIVDRHCRAIRALLDRLDVAEHRLDTIVAGNDVFARKHNGGCIADEYRSNKLILSPANDDRINGAAEILRRLGDADADPPIPPRVFISEDCPRLIETLPALEHDPLRPEDVSKVDCDDDGIGGDDSYDSFRYALMHAAQPKARKPRATAIKRPALDGFQVR